ncbi:hypothetical protein Tdes44962_MAKER09105 [Teratosphaeria destructans]|uniref:Uncharacterized protein n=1 Tax=Teratosphaeria destructans TaxID=418781 RepID=A0A9W7W3S5_9PEZI|nr:hypothetical protein Tdes44962_MAKER09105 [Teratosphaeria destructans]
MTVVSTTLIRGAHAPDTLACTNCDPQASSMNFAAAEYSLVIGVLRFVAPEAKMFMVDRRHSSHVGFEPAGKPTPNGR